MRALARSGRRHPYRPAGGLGAPTVTLESQPIGIKWGDVRLRDVHLTDPVMSGKADPWSEVPDYEQQLRDAELIARQAFSPEQFVLASTLLAALRGFPLFSRQGVPFSALTPEFICNFAGVGQEATRSPPAKATKRSLSRLNVRLIRSTPIATGPLWFQKTTARHASCRTSPHDHRGGHPYDQLMTA
jgi:hypothetical protein